MRLSKLTQSRPTEATIDVLGDDVKVTYDRAIISRAFLDQLVSLAEKLAAVLLAWDVVDDAGAPYAPGEGADRRQVWLELFAPIPDDVLRAVWRGILDDYYVKNPLGAV